LKPFPKSKAGRREVPLPGRQRRESSWPRGRPVSVMGFTVRNEKIIAIDVLADPARLRQLDLTAWTD
jgi:hypothetical protein